MGYFPMSVDLRGRRVLLVGDGPQIDDKMVKLQPFGAELIRCSTPDVAMLTENVALVVAGDLDLEEATRISALCREKRIPVNVVDAPTLSTFFFPALITRGDLTVSVSTGGKVPGAAAKLAHRIAADLPDQIEDRLDAFCALRRQLYADYPTETARTLLRQAIAEAFDS